ncbi:MAG: right-handed parallel beta-helix repeat-containing protein [Wenzhouxiangella sp.]|nr:right-handed parallel beta-helix repeat-containing protein [Wenzhouxiangella sp.]MCH8477843.1 right-handed parallel beta-helix repeat-containing protein [Wenzhouxiangella sp.]TVR91385.1 MAG: right-handed parallel beta-helix repeat-containing protein [Wenzhouxiangellaceae bacterium]
MTAKLICCALLLAAGSAKALTLTINSLGDQGADLAGNGVCSTGDVIVLPGGGPALTECTLRAALEEANASSAHVLINVSPFIESDINGYSIINVSTGLPFISSRVTIAGDTHPNHQSGTRQTPLVVNWAGSSSANVSGIRFTSSGAGSYSEVRNIAITRFPNSGILVNGGTGYLIQGNFIGNRWLPFSTGFLTEGNGSHGIDINNGSSMPDPTTIVDNVIYQNGGDGIHLRGGTATTFITNNIIGLAPSLSNASGKPFEATKSDTAILGNLGAGIYVAESAGGFNRIGIEGGNTISNNEGGGIRVRADFQQIGSNLIGLPHEFSLSPANDPGDYGNAGSSLVLESSNNSVGFGSGGTANYIGNSGAVGIRIGSGSSSAPLVANDNVIRANVIGTDLDGNSQGQPQGIRIDNGSGNEIDNNTIVHNGTGIEIRSAGNSITRNRVRNSNVAGIWARQAVQIGALSGDSGNVIGNNTRGILVSNEVGGSAGLVQIINNYIGTNADGDSIGNTTGVQLEGARPVRLGFAGNGNVIGNSSGSGIWLTSQASNKEIQSNWIGAHPDGHAIGNFRGVRLSGSAVAGNVIGYEFQNINPNSWSPGSGLSNVIANSSSFGVDLAGADDASVGNLIRGNQFFANNGVGINLGMSELDPDGASSGPNELMNFPEIDASQTSFDPSSNELSYRYRVLTTSGNAAYPLRIDFYLADGDSSEGRFFLGSDDYQAAEAGFWKTGSLSSPLPGGGDMNGAIIATATDSDGNTSQFTIEGAVVSQDVLFQDRFQ